MTKQLLISAAIVIASIFLAVMLVKSRSKPPQRPVENQAPLVQTAPIHVRTGALIVTGSGTVTPRAEVTLSAQISGKVIYVNPALVSGGYVREGETLVRIDGADFENAVEQAKADVAQQEVSVLQAREESQLARAEYDRFTSRESKRTSDTYATIDSNDYAAGLIGKKSIRQSDTAQVLDSGTGDESTPSGLVFREPQLRAAEAALQRSRASLSTANLQSDRTVVRAPFSGFVRNKNVAVGSFLSPGQSFGQLVASDIFEISVPITREEAALIPNLWSSQGGQKNASTVYANYGTLRYKWQGYIDRAEAVLNPETRTINVVVRVPSPITSGQLASSPNSGASEGSEIIPSKSPPLLVGEFVEVEVEGGALERYLVVPRSALRDDNSIWIVRDNKIEIIPVDVLQEADDSAYIIADGVNEGDQIVTSALSAVTPGMQVRTEANQGSPTGAMSGAGSSLAPNAEMSRTPAAPTTANE